VIAAQQRLVVIRHVRRRAEANLVIRCRGSRHKLHQLHAHRIKARLRDHIVREQIAGERVADNAGPVGEQPLAEIAGFHGGTGNGAERGRSRRAGSRALVGREEKRAILLNRTTQRAAKLVALDRIATGEEVRGIQIVIAEKVEERPVEIVGTRLGDHVDDAPDASAVLRIERTGLHAEFLHCVDIRERTGQAGLRLVVVGIVQQVIGGGAARAVYRNGVDQARPAEVRPLDCRRYASVGDACVQREQLQHVAAVERQVGDALRVDHLDESGRGCLYERRWSSPSPARRRRGLAGWRRLHLRVGLQRNSLLHERREAFLLHAYVVVPQRKQREYVLSRMVRHGRARLIGACICCGDGGARNHRAGRIVYRPTDGAGGLAE
jgi:hypothetical protein